ncbi:MAG: alpha/beta fold hydrolase [Pseudoxanthomonas sp.]
MSWSGKTATLLLAAALLPLLGGCAMVKEKQWKSEDYVAAVRGDILSVGELSAAGRETLQVGGIDEKSCRADLASCTPKLDAIIDVERRLATESELWLGEAIHLAKDDKTPADTLANAWLESARRAYAYLFFTERKPGERAFENRQTQVRDYYNYAVQGVVGLMFERWRDNPNGMELRIGDWEIESAMQGYRLPGGALLPRAAQPASSLRLEGLRSTYRRDGFGAELVAEVSAYEVGAPLTNDEGEVLPPSPRRRTGPAAFSEIPFAPTTVLLEFKGRTLDEILASRTARVSAYDPYDRDEVEIEGVRVPLAGNFTAPYGLWLARSGFATQSLRSLLGKDNALDGAHLYLMQPFDPDKRVLVLLHGLASSPEAWVNLANELLGDERLRQHYQIWLAYYPTNLPIPVSRIEIGNLIEQALRHFDPKRDSAASQHMVLVGHSMGGVIARLLVSDSSETVWDTLMANRKLEGTHARQVRERLGPLLHFQPLPQVDRAIFLAAPHRGTVAAGSKLGRFIAGLVKLPFTLLEGFGEVMQDLAGIEGETGKDGKPRIPNSIDNLREDDPFIRAAADLPISPQVRYHSIIAKYRDKGKPLEEVDDGVVPYRSAHLPGAASELVLDSFHNVQEKPQAILEIRRILREQMASESASGN